MKNMCATTKKGETSDETSAVAMDVEWTTLLEEAAAAAGVERIIREVEQDARSAERRRRNEVDRGEASAHRIESIRGLRRIELDPRCGELRPRSIVPASTRGSLIAGPRIAAAASSVDAAARELRMTCQAGRYEMHREARTAFPTEWICHSGRYNLARAALRADLPAGTLAGMTGGRVLANVVVPTAFDNDLQRVWRLAVPSRDMLLSAQAPHLAVTGVRGWIELSVDDNSGNVARQRRTFLKRALSAHAPRDLRGFGPVRGPHALEVEIEGLDPTAALAIRVGVTLVSLLEGDADAYSEEAPFYAGVDFGGGGTARMPEKALSAFKIPLTPLIENDPITVSHLGFIARA